MDSLIVLRKPLRKTQLEPKLIIPKKSKKTVPKVDLIHPNPDLGAESNGPPISFVKLYNDLCVENSICETSCLHARSPTRMCMCLPSCVHVNSTCVDLDSAAGVVVSPAAPQFECPLDQLHTNTPASRTEVSRSDTSLVTHYFPNVECNRVFTDVSPPPSSAQVEVILELAYDTISKDSGFC